MEAVVVDAGSKLLKAGFAVPDHLPSMTGFAIIYCPVSCHLNGAYMEFLLKQGRSSKDISEQAPSSSHPPKNQTTVSREHFNGRNGETKVNFFATTFSFARQCSQEWTFLVVGVNGGGKTTSLDNPIKLILEYIF